MFICNIFRKVKCAMHVYVHSASWDPSASLECPGTFTKGHWTAGKKSFFIAVVVYKYSCFIHIYFLYLVRIFFLCGGEIKVRLYIGAAYSRDLSLIYTKVQITTHNMPNFKKN